MNYEQKKILISEIGRAGIIVSFRKDQLALGKEWHQPCVAFYGNWYKDIPALFAIICSHPISRGNTDIDAVLAINQRWMEMCYEYGWQPKRLKEDNISLDVVCCAMRTIWGFNQIQPQESNPAFDIDDILIVSKVLNAAIKQGVWDGKLTCENYESVKKLADEAIVRYRTKCVSSYDQEARIESSTAESIGIKNAEHIPLPKYGLVVTGHIDLDSLNKPVVNKKDKIEKEIQIAIEEKKKEEKEANRLKRERWNLTGINKLAADLKTYVNNYHYQLVADTIIKMADIAINFVGNPEPEKEEEETICEECVDPKKFIPRLTMTMASIRINKPRSMYLITFSKDFSSILGKRAHDGYRVYTVNGSNSVFISFVKYDKEGMCSGMVKFNETNASLQSKSMVEFITSKIPFDYQYGQIAYSIEKLDLEETKIRILSISK